MMRLTMIILALGLGAWSSGAQAQQGFDGTWHAMLPTEGEQSVQLDLTIEAGRYTALTTTTAPGADGGPLQERQQHQSGLFGFQPPGMIGLKVEDWGPQTGPDGEALFAPPDRLFRIFGGSANTMLLLDLGCAEASGSAPACMFEMTLEQAEPAN